MPLRFPIRAMPASLVAAAAVLGPASPADAGSDGCVPPKSATKEIEACGGAGNDGCNTLAHLTEPIGFGQAVAASFWADPSHRDTDFFRFAIAVPTVVRASAWSESFLQLALVDTCSVVASDAGACTAIEACLPPGVYEVFVSPLDAFPSCGTAESGYTVLLDVVQDAPPCTPLVGDLDRDGVVGPYDLNMLLIAWGSVNPGSADLSGDAVADGCDLGMLLGAWTR